MRNLALTLWALVALALCQTGCSTQEPDHVPLHEDVMALAKVNPYVGIAIVLRAPLYMAAIAGVIFAVATLTMADNTRKKIKDAHENH